MTVNYTTNLALGQPVTGTESGTWGDDVNNSVTSYLDIAIAGGLAITVTTADVTLTLTQGTSSATNIGSTTAQYAILNVSGAMTAARNLILPSSSRQYVINNNTTGGFALTVKGSATSGVTMVNGEKAHVFWNGSDYAKLSNTPGGAGTFSSITNTGLTSGRVVYSTTGGLETDSANLTFDGTNLTLLGGTANGVAYLNGSKVLTTGSALTFDGTTFNNTQSGGAAQLQFNALTFTRSGANYITASNSTLNYLASQHVFGDNTLANEWMRLTSTGLGIGTSSPAYKLDVTGTINSGASSATGYNLVFRTSGITTGRAQTTLINTSGNLTTGVEGSSGGASYSGTAAYSSFVATDGANPFYVITNSAIRATFDSSGNLGLGVTPSAWGSAYKSLEVNGAVIQASSANKSQAGFGNNYYHNGTNYIYSTSNYATLYFQTGGVHSWYNAPSGTAGNAITFTQAMTLDASGNLGIGVTAPEQKLHIGGNNGIRFGNASSNPKADINYTSGGAEFLDIKIQGTTAGYGNIRFSTGGTPTEAMRIDSSGNVGIGTTSVTSKLDVVSTSGTYAGGIRVNGTASGNSSSGMYIVGAQATTHYNWLIGSQFNVGNAFEITPSTAVNGTTFSTPSLIIDISGNVGIGTNAPSQKLQVNGAIIIGNYGSNQYLYFDGTTNYVGRNTSNGDIYLASAAGQGVVFSVGGTERARIDSSGNFLVGTTSQSGKLAVNGAATSAPLVTFYSSTAGDVGQAGLLIGKQDNNTTTSQIILRASILSTGAGAGQINMNGANSLAFGTYSDQRLKENIVDLPLQLANIMALRPVEFDYIESEGGGHQTGFIAQEIQQIYPDAVGKREDGMLTVSGWSKTEARLVKAIQEQQAIIKSLKARLDAANL